MELMELLRIIEIELLHNPSELGKQKGGVGGG